MIYRIAKLRDWSECGVAIEYTDIPNPNLDVLKIMYEQYEEHLNQVIVKGQGRMYCPGITDADEGSVFHKFLLDTIANVNNKNFIIKIDKVLK